MPVPTQHLKISCNCPISLYIYF